MCVLVGLASTVATSTWAQDFEETRPVVRGISFRGNRSIDDALLRISISNTQSSAFQRPAVLRWLPFGEKRYLNERQLRTDLLRVRALYNQSGFFEATVDTVVERSDGNVHITFVIEEGRPVVVTDLTILGIDTLVNVREAERSLPLHVGDPFNRRLLQASVDSLVAQLHRIGYPFAEVFTRFTEDRAERVASVTLDVDPAMRVRVGEVEVVGADEITQEVVRGLVPIQVGQLFNEEQLYEGQIDLFRLGVYNHVSLSLVDSVPPDDSLVTVRVRLTEADLRRVRLGGGYGTTDCFRALGQWTINNFRGGGRRLGLSGRVSRLGVGESMGDLQNRFICRSLESDLDSLLTLNYNVTASLHQPAFLSRRTSGTVSIFGERRSEFRAYRRDAQGIELLLTQQIALNLPLSVSYALSSGRTIADPATQCQFLNTCLNADTIFNSRRITSKVTVGIVREDRNSVIDPRQGSYLSAQVSFAHPAIGSDELSQFLRGVIEYGSHHQVARDRTLSWRVRLGAMLVPLVELDAGNFGRYAPPEERFYAGGAASVRGVAQNELGPVVYVKEPIAGTTDTVLRASPLGGNGIILGNVEYRLPLAGFSNRFYGAAFIDVGSVFSFSEITRGSPTALGTNLRITPGVGVRLASPIGPIRFDFALNLRDPQPGQLFVSDGGVLTEVTTEPDFRPPQGFLGPFRFHLSIGQAF